MEVFSAIAQRYTQARRGQRALSKTKFGGEPVDRSNGGNPLIETSLFSRWEKICKNARNVAGSSRFGHSEFSNFFDYFARAVATKSDGLIKTERNH